MKVLCVTVVLLFSIFVSLVAAQDDDCRRMCPMMFNPICGKLDGEEKIVTFPNQCEFDNENDCSSDGIAGRKYIETECVENYYESK